MKKAILVAIIGAFALSANAGDWGKAPVPAKAPIEECLDIGGEISAGYMTDYIFYGQRLARDSVWTDVNYTFDSMFVPITIGAWYLNGIGEAAVGAADELDLYISADLGSFAGFDVQLGYVHYFFPEAVGAGSYGEVGLDISRSLGFVDFAWESNYAIMGRSGPTLAHQGGGWYHQASLSKTFGLLDVADLVLTGGVGFADGYWNSGVNTGVNPPATLATIGNRSNGWSHYFITAELPIELNCRATLTPYVGYNGAPDGWVMDGARAIGANSIQSDILHGGVSISVSF